VLACDRPLPTDPCRPPPSMPPRRTPRRPKRDRQRQALKLLASAPTGCTEALLFAYGVTVETLIELIRNGLATAHGENVVAGRKTMEIARVRITEAGRRVVAEARR
jgi:hypothetical protein